MPIYSSVFPYDVMVSLLVSASVFMEPSTFVTNQGEKSRGGINTYMMHLCQSEGQFPSDNSTKQGFIEVPREENSRQLAIGAHDTAGTWNSRRP